MAVHLSKRRAKVWLQYLKHTRGDRGRLSLNILREVCSFLHCPKRITAVCGKTAFLYDTQGQLLSEHTLSVDFGVAGSYIEADRNTLLCVGGSSAVYSLDLSSFQLSSLPSLCTPRAFAGLAQVNVHFYVFGGCADGRLSSCEKMHLSGQCWTQISSMNYPRVFFTPCHFRSLLYLASAFDHYKVETFDAETETFVVLPVLQSNY